MRKPTSLFDDESGHLSALERLWALRLLVPLGALKRLVTETIGNHEAFIAVGAGDPALDQLNDVDRYKRLVPRVTALWRKAEASADRATPPEVLTVNLKKLGATLGLDGTDIQLLQWACLVASSPMLAEIAGSIGNVAAGAAMAALAKVLDLPLVQVQRALARGGTLAHSGLLRLEMGDRQRLHEKIQLLSPEFVDAIATPDVAPLQLIRGSVRPGLQPTLSLQDFPHLEPDLASLRPYLRQALDERNAGVNVLFYGPPGTGKTELARVLARDLGSELLEVVSEDDDGDLITAAQRVQAYNAAQRLLARSRSLVLFDECSDAFADSGPGSWSRHLGRPLRGGKGWFNQTLERNPVPTFWLTNDVSTMDPSLLRRFDIVVEMGVPPRAVRHKIARSCCGAVASPETVDLLADSEALAPAVMTRAASVMSQLAAEGAAQSTDATLLRLVNQTLRVQGHAEVRAKDPTRLPEIYEPSLVNADTDLVALQQGIRRAGAARLCLYGPPGTGKSAYARWLARELGRPLHLRRASDLISMWVGQTEKNIAKAFREAEQEGAVLVLDEVDGFLRDRRSAQRSWEVTEVNEMLTQMESFAGVFVATTNLMEDLDPASLRRFDLKARFDHLRPQQSSELLLRHCQALQLDGPSEEDIGRISQLATLTPGDFAAVVRRHAFQPLATAGAMLDALAAECSLKSGGRQGIGFVIQ